MRRFAAVILLAAVGCGGNPEKDRLAAGSRATLYNEKGDSVLVGKNVDNFVDAGTEVMIVADEDQPGDESALRKVRINIKEGPYRGIGGRVERYKLRPAR